MANRSVSNCSFAEKRRERTTFFHTFQRAVARLARTQLNRMFTTSFITTYALAYALALLLLLGLRWKTAASKRRGRASPRGKQHRMMSRMMSEMKRHADLESCCTYTQVGVYQTRKSQRFRVRQKTLAQAGRSAPPPPRSLTKVCYPTVHDLRLGSRQIMSYSWLGFGNHSWLQANGRMAISQRDGKLLQRNKHHWMRRIEFYQELLRP